MPQKPLPTTVVPPVPAPPPPPMPTPPVGPATEHAPLFVEDQQGWPDMQAPEPGMDKLDILLQCLADIQSDLTTLKIKPTMAEAGFSMNFALMSPAPNSVPFQVTFRRATIEEAEGAMGLVKSWLDARLSGGWRFNVPQPPTEPKVDAIAREAGGQKAVDAVKDARAAAPAPTTRTGAPPKSMRIHKLEVKAGKEWGRATLAFFNDLTHRFADLQVQNWPVDKAMGILSAVMDTNDLLVKAANGTVGVMPAAFALECLAIYQEGKEYSKPDGSTDHYKDLIELRPLPTGA